MNKQPLQISGNLLGLVLAVLNDAPLHGYGIAREIEKRSKDALSFGEGALYPALKALEVKGFVEGRWDTSSESGPARKVYEITGEGKKELTRVREAWKAYCSSVNLVFEGVPQAQST